MEEIEEETEEHVCPFCGKEDDCPHILLIVDECFRTASGGELYSIFNDVWATNFPGVDDIDEDFDESEEFAEILEVVDNHCAGLSAFDVDSPGQSTTFTTYYFNSPEALANAKAALMYSRKVTIAAYWEENARLKTLIPYYLWREIIDGGEFTFSENCTLDNKIVEIYWIFNKNSPGSFCIENKKNSVILHEGSVGDLSVEDLIQPSD